MLANQSSGVPRAHLLTTLTAVVGVALLALAWGLAWRATRGQPRFSIRRLWWVVGVWTAPLLFAAPFATQDVWTYGAEGKMVLEGLGGYRAPTVLGHSVWIHGVDSEWIAHHAPYGPGALDLSAFFVKISGGRPWVAAECWRISAIVGMILCAWGVGRVVSIRGGNATAATMAGVVNPAVLIILVGGMHNDALMLGLMVAGVALAMSGKRSGGMFLCVLAMAVKPNALLAVGALSWFTWGCLWRQRIKGVALAVAAVGCVFVVSGLGVGGGFGWIRADSYGSLTGPWSIGPKFFGVETGWPIVLIELVGLALAVALVLRIGRSGRWVVALGWGFLVVALTVPKPEPWYLTWSVALLACGGLTRRLEQGAVWTLVAMMVGTLLPLAFVWWLGGVVLLVWLAAISARGRREQLRAGNAPEIPLDLESSDEQMPALALTPASPHISD
jgi:hypothetical protein